jgi:hypothetical protein
MYEVEFELRGCWFLKFHGITFGGCRSKGMLNWCYILYECKHLQCKGKVISKF